MVRLEKFIDDPLIAIGIINFDILGHTWKNQLKFQLKTLNGSKVIKTKILSLISLAELYKLTKPNNMEKWKNLSDIS